MPSDHDHPWRAISGGLRPSVVLFVGSLVLPLGPACEVLGDGAGWPWLVWLAGLALVGLGLLLSGLRPWSTPMVAVTGLLFLIHAGALALALAGIGPAARAYQLLAIPRIVALGLLAITERQHQGIPRLLALAAASLAGIAKIGWRTFNPEAEIGAVPDLAVILITSAALLALARGMDKREETWARRRLAGIDASLVDFGRIDD